MLDQAARQAVRSGRMLRRGVGPVPVRRPERAGRALLLVLSGALLSACSATRVPTTWSPVPDFSEPLPLLGDVKPASERAHQDPRLHLALALSGGGHRAANFALGVLLGLEQTPLDAASDRDLLDEVDLVSSVSGGGFAAAAWLGSLRDARVSGATPADYSLARVLRGQQPHTDPGARRHLERGYTDDILSAPLRSTRLLFDPSLNRTDAFEETVDDAVLGAEWRSDQGSGDHEAALAACLGTDGSLRLSDVFVPVWEPREVLLPHWAINATAYENGAIVPFLPGTLMQYGISRWTHRMRSEPPFDAPVVGQPENFCSSAGDHPSLECILRMPLAVGVTASANFPGVLPPTNLESRLDPRNRQLLLVDGGVADNLGVLTALRLLEQTPPGERRVLVVVDAANGPLGPFSQVDNPNGLTVASNLLASTFLGAWHGRARRMLERHCAESDIGLVFLSFEDLMGPDDRRALLDLPPILGDELDLTEEKWKQVVHESEGPLRLPGPRAPRAADPEHSQQNLRPFELLRAIPTDFQCTNAEQRLLLAAGRLALAKHREELLALLR